VLIVEDEPLIALAIEAIVLERAPRADVVLAGSVDQARAAIETPLQLAFLDVDVTDGQTYCIALDLQAREVPFVFVSGTNFARAPEALAAARFISKPFSTPDIVRAIDDAEGEGR
jgi:DNA-binding NtrC family response regulator